MRVRLPLFALLASSLVFLVSLYLPWQETNQGAGGGVLSLLNRFSTTSGPFDGWTTAGAAAALAALATAFTAAVAIARPARGRHLPIGVCAVALAYFAIGGLVERHALNNFLKLTVHAVRFHYAYGVYLALASIVVALLAAIALELGKPRRRPSPTEGAMAVLALGVLISFLLPWEQIARFSFPAIGTASATLAAFALFAGVAVRRSDVRLAAAAATALLTGATISLVSRGGSVAYGAWMALGFAVTLVAVAAVAARSGLDLPRLKRLAACRAGAAIVLIAALFMPWSTLGFNGWWSVGTPGSVAGGLAILVVAALGSPPLERYVVELSVGIAIFVTTLGFAVNNVAAIGGAFAYGAYVGFAAAALLVLLALAELRHRLPNRAPLPLQSLAIAASFVYLAIVVAAQWSVVPNSLQLEAPPLFTWLGVASVLLAIHLVASWVRLAAGSTSLAHELVLIPAALLALVTLGAVVDRGQEPNWGLAVVLALGVILVVLGWVEPRGGIERLRLPETLRFDRLPEAES